MFCSTNLQRQIIYISILYTKEILALNASLIVFQTFENPLQKRLTCSSRLLLSRNAGVLIMFCQIVKNYYRLISPSNLVVSA